MLADRGHAEEGIAQMRQGLASLQASTERSLPYWFGLLAEVYGKVGQPQEGIHVEGQVEPFAKKMLPIFSVRGASSKAQKAKNETGP
jgi:hypothetical protein